jgi:hypothetical protein
MKTKKSIWVLPILIIGIVLFLTNSCDEASDANDTNDNTGNPVQNNGTVQDVLLQAGIYTFNGSAPPSLEGTFSTTPMKCYDATGNLTPYIGYNMTTICRFYDQTSGGNISFAEQISPNLFADSKGAYITGSDLNFTIWMINALSNGAETAFVLSGTLDQTTGNLVNCKSVTIYTKASASYNVGDWCAYSGSLEANGGQTTGDGVFYTSQDYGCGPVSVTVDGSAAGTISVYYPSGAPECGASGCVTITKEPGNYGFTAECSSYIWQGSINIVKGQCTKFHLTGKNMQLKMNSAD